MDEVQVGSSAERTMLDVTALQHQLETQYFGSGEKLFYLPVVTSTNTIAMQLARSGSEEGVVVLTDSQTAGRGRQGRRWVDVSGCNVLLSTLLRPLFPPHFLVMLASLAVVDAIRETCGISATIKWPNDVLVRDAKVAGILIETSHLSSEQSPAGQLVAILGIGVNVNGRIQSVPGGTSLVATGAQDNPTQSAPLEREQVALAAAATTLEAECGNVVSRETFIAHMLRHLESDYLALQQEARSPLSTASGSPVARSIRERWRSYLSTPGRTVQVRQGDAVIDGIALGVDDSGELLLRRHSGELVSITWGDVGYSTG